jgi:hypothetical protein
MKERPLPKGTFTTITTERSPLVGGVTEENR